MKEDGARLFPVMSSDMPVASCPKPAHRNIRKHFLCCVGGKPLPQVAQRVCGVSVLGDTQKLPGCMLLGEQYQVPLLELQLDQKDPELPPASTSLWF